MLDFVGNKVSLRKLRLFAVACGRSIWRPLKKKRSRKAVEIAEQYADNLVDFEQLHTAHASASATFQETDDNTIEEVIAGIATDIAMDDALEAASSAVNAADVIAHLAVYGWEPDDPPSTDERQAAYKARQTTEHAAQCQLLRCIIGSPFRSPRLDPAFRTPSVLTLAQAAYEERILPSGHLDSTRLLILADALEEAGCSAGPLTHLRDPGPHVRGCWPMDIILGKK